MTSLRSRPRVYRGARLVNENRVTLRRRAREALERLHFYIREMRTYCYVRAVHDEQTTSYDYTITKKTYINDKLIYTLDSIT